MERWRPCARTGRPETVRSGETTPGPPFRLAIPVGMSEVACRQGSRRGKKPEANDVGVQAHMNGRGAAMRKRNHCGAWRREDVSGSGSVQMPSDVLCIGHVCIGNSPRNHPTVSLPDAGHPRSISSREDQHTHRGRPSAISPTAATRFFDVALRCEDTVSGPDGVPSPPGRLASQKTPDLGNCV
jgi:hypothetical protein